MTNSPENQENDAETEQPIDEVEEELERLSHLHESNNVFAELFPDNPTFKYQEYNPYEDLLLLRPCFMQLPIEIQPKIDPPPTEPPKPSDSQPKSLLEQHIDVLSEIPTREFRYISARERLLEYEKSEETRVLKEQKDQERDAYFTQQEELAKQAKKDETRTERINRNEVRNSNHTN